MRAPPPVEYTGSLGRAWRAALSMLVGASVAVPLAWGLPPVAAQWGSLQPGALFEALRNPVVQAALPVWVAAMVVVAVWIASKRAGREYTLRWDGQDWVLTGSPGRGADRRGDAALMLDLGPWMLVRFLPCTGPGAGTWLPLTVAGDLARWAALRGALWNWRSQQAGRP